METGLSASSGRLPITYMDVTRLHSVRKLTPDSEALASSDDEQDLTKSVHSLHSVQSQSSQQNNNSNQTTRRATRRPSWLDQVRSGPPRRSSTTSSTSITNAIHPQETVLEDLSRQTSLPTTASARAPGSQVFTTTSPSQFMTPESRALENFSYQNSQGGLHREALPFAIPLQPTPKTYRSLSYSVGQMENELADQNQQSGMPPPSLPRRPGRPSMLTQVSEGGNMMTALNEEVDDDDDEESRPNSQAGVSLSAVSRPDRPSESSPNPLLRQATNTLIRTRSGNNYEYAPSMISPPLSIEQDDGLGSGLTARFNELGGLGGNSESLRRSQWHTTLGFGNLPDIPQSRRHSMADMPTRRGSLVAAAANENTLFRPTSNEQSLASAEYASQSPTMLSMSQQDAQNRKYADAYFSGYGPAIRSTLNAQSPDSSAPHSSVYPGAYGRHGQDVKMYLVSFKCARAELYYLATGTGLTINEGDLVVVEADRGVDLGTVWRIAENWTEAQKLKEASDEEHYRWLMMFSHNNKAQEGTAAGEGPAGMMAKLAPEYPSMGSRGMQGAQMPGAPTSPSNSEAKPKMIKRLASSHEIGTLRDKEGQEAKAKRIGQQKVKDHALNMEILDCEFQMDWKKLTYYYFATSYVNFNPLVTELFKIYKTRIWMSAINPASLSGPLPPPTAVGAGALQDRNVPRRWTGTIPWVPPGAPAPSASVWGLAHPSSQNFPSYNNTNNNANNTNNNNMNMSNMHRQTGSPPQNDTSYNSFAGQQSTYQYGGFSPYETAAPSPRPHYESMGHAFGRPPQDPRTTNGFGYGMPEQTNGQRRYDPFSVGPIGPPSSSQTGNR